MVNNDTAGGRFRDIRELTRLTREELLKETKEELADMYVAIARELVAVKDITCGPESAARFFNKKRSWVYDAIRRPTTKLQRGIARIVVREKGGLLFRLSDLVKLRRRLFRKDKDE